MDFGGFINQIGESSMSPWKLSADEKRPFILDLYKSDKRNKSHGISANLY